YGIIGLLGYFAARKTGLPGIYSPEGGWRRWVVIPLLLSIPCALGLIFGDLLFAPINGLGLFPHPTFPLSFFASISAGIGEEILFRLFVFSVWALLLTWLFKRFNGRTAALWIANVIAALGFAAGHLFSLAMISGAAVFDSSGSMTFLFDKINPVLVTEAFLLNGVIGLLAGWRYMKDGLVAAVGVHFWTDIFWHVLWGLFPG
ncbi:MAG: CPBP family intramembrane metalloprotease, partial [Chloroflexi bacterium]